MLRCEGICKRFGPSAVLTEVSLCFPVSGLVALVGPNGAGKTTLLRILTGGLRPEVGHCFIGERETTHLAPHRIAALGVARTFQEVRLIRSLSVIDNVLLACPRQRGESLVFALSRWGIAQEEARRHETVRQILRFVGLEAHADSAAAALSYGQQKLLAFACCLTTDARILLLDEPVAGVHPDMVLHILELLVQIRQTNKLIVFVEHDLSAVRQIAEHVVVMERGSVIAEGTPANVLSRPDVIDAYLA